MWESRRVAVAVALILAVAATSALGACTRFQLEEATPGASDGEAETTASDSGVRSRFDGSLPEASIVSDGHLYAVVISPTPQTWPEARAAAELAGGHLVTIASKDEDDVVRSLLSDRLFAAAGGSGPWIGLYQPEPSTASEPGGGWAWVDGTPFAYMGWLSTEPNNASEREHVGNFAGMWPDSIGWNDENAAQPGVSAFIMEIDP